ncbi:MAG: DNA translocase FtsK, partial [Planctomycetota bacterium]
LGELLIYYFGTVGTTLLCAYLLLVSLIICSNGLILAGITKSTVILYKLVLLGYKQLCRFFVTLFLYFYTKIKEKKNARITRSAGNGSKATYPTIYSGEKERKTPTLKILSPKEEDKVSQGLQQPKMEEETYVAEGNISEKLSKKEQKDNYEFPPLDLLEDIVNVELDRSEIDPDEEKEILNTTLLSFDIENKVVGVEKGPAVTTYEIELGPGTRLQKVLSVADDLAIALKAPSVRIIAPIPGKSTIGVEVPNAYKDIVTLKELLIERKKYSSYKLPLFLGKSAGGEPIIEDLSEFPHLLIAGTTGSGKSVALNSIIVAFLYLKTPTELKMILIDPKVVELSFYNDIPHLFCPVVTDVNKAKKILEWLINEMDERYELFSKVGVKKIEQYNRMSKEEIIEILGEGEEDIPIISHPMEYLVVIVDELNDLMMAANKEVEGAILRLSQKARAVGIHLILATQRPSVDVITGLIKANIPARIAFKVVSKVDSRTILDRMGAEKLLGKGDMLFLKPGAFDLIRIQGCYVSEKDIEKISDYWKQYKTKSQQQPEFLQTKCEDSDIEIFSDKDDEELLEEAIKIVLESKRGSVSLVQRKLGIGYCRAARLVEKMAEMGLLGEYRGAKPRQVLISYEEYLSRKKGKNHQ